ncbi:hypothetical protein MBEHAL_2560 [Halarchaeum acidiphilum MH1-52-1]|uniref:Uncharacterized protein n=1 Tax=Halarchaeum acidiphilum MH1-52-1 TaxID=1261545 RepID=U2YXM9_9EURY|nr:hypothetical protein MBEHAL_2560 [Halarchaeum acidiphilum MH1-52-1]
MHHRPLNFRVARRLRVRPFGGDGVDLVDEEDRRLLLLGEVEEVADEARPLTDELLDELAAGHLDERRVRLVRDGLRHHRLPRARRAVEQDAARRFDADGLELLGVDEGVLDGLAHLAQFRFETADVLVLDGRRLIDLHRLRAGVRLVVEDVLNAERVVDRDAIADLDALARPLGDVRQYLLIVPVLLDDRAVLGEILDRREVEGGGLQRLVLALKVVDVLAEVGAVVPHRRQLLFELIVHVDQPAEVVSERRQPLFRARFGIELERRPIRESRATRHSLTAIGPAERRSFGSRTHPVAV